MEQLKIVFDNGHVEHWLNGQKIVEFEAWTDDWHAKKNSGKWANAPEYGLAKKVCFVCKIMVIPHLSVT